MSLTTEQELMQEVVNRISDKYPAGRADLLIEESKKIADAILSYKNDKEADE